MSNQATLTFAGDSKDLQKAAKQSDAAIDTVGKSATSAADDFKKSDQASAGFTDRLGKLGAGVSGMTDALDSAGGALQGVIDLQNAGRERAMKLARAQADVEQAMMDGEQAAVDLEQATLDLNQAQTDGKQAALDAGQAQIDQKQALVDAATATDDYNKAVKEHGKGSVEAKQALVDMDQAQQDSKQATLDLEQANRDATQAQIDQKQAVVDGSQAVRDGKDAQLDLNDAMAEANPSGLQKWADNLNLIAPILSAVVGVVGLVTAAQWAWNAAQLASPTTWIILAVVALIAVIVIIATKTKWFQNIWKAAWGGIKTAASAVGSWFKNTLWGYWIKGTWDLIKSKGEAVWKWMTGAPGRIKSAFANVTNFIFQPFRTAFNRIADGWNRTVGNIGFSVPGWVPGIGGASFSVPDIPHFHSGGIIPGVIGSPQMALLQGGERVTAATSSRGDDEFIALGGEFVDALIAMIRHRVGSLGGKPIQLGIKIKTG